MRYTDLTQALQEPQHVIELDLTHAGITDWPDTTRAFERLERLNLSGNPGLPWAELFSALAQHPGLKKLVMADNEIKELPASIGRLTQLEHLYLDNNGLSELPSELGGLSGLTNFSADHNQFTAFPDALLQLSELKFISLNHNQITRLPANIGKLTKLVTFHMKENAFSQESLAEGRAQLAKSVYIFKA